MDLYLTSAEPGLTLQEMIDCDIKSGVDFETGFTGDPFMASFDISSMTGLDASELDLKSLEPLFDPLEEEEAMETGGGSRGVTGDTSPVASWMNLSAMTNFNLDVETSLMVNPSVVLPSPHHSKGAEQGLGVGVPLILKKELTTLQNTFQSHSSSTKSSVVIGGGVHSSHTPVTTQVVLRPITTPTTSSTTTPPDSIPSFITTTSPPTAGITNSVTTPRHTTPTTVTPINTTNNHHQKQLNHTNGATTLATTTTTSAIPVYQSSRANGTTSFAASRSKPSVPHPHQKYRRSRTPPEEARSYPKPAYSYACLIALALKNSITGSLPVSEIYSFMCEHFPYFRTAPNGWKNSVRHNLSLNKCFEKIEKPVVSGSNQRKGCLWALNPQKAHKMDEEVQKWSKKDLQGIRDAMTCPEVLESLEKGEMKFEATSGASSCSEDEEDEELLIDPITFNDLPRAPIKVFSSNPVVIPPPGGGVGNTSSTKTSHQNGFRSSPKSFQIQDSPANHIHHSAATTHGQPQHIVRRTISSSPEPEYILPDSTMSEINIQSNGALIDDFGNEITLDGDLSILNPRGCSSSSSSSLSSSLSSSSQSSGTNLILRKVNAASSPLRNSSIRSNFVYSTPSSGALIPPHQNALNRLVLTNAKMSS